MKKNKYIKREAVKSGNLKKNILTVLLSVSVFMATAYGFKCFVTKVCGVTFLDSFVRSEYIVLMPKGALEVEVANTKASRELGLSGRKSMSDEEGLLFVFDEPGRYGFWMKDMTFALDLVWINEDGIVVSLEREVATSTYPKVFMNQSGASYVLEINAGQAQKFGLYLGSKVKMTD